jgi:hypothetical protein
MWPGRYNPEADSRRLGRQSGFPLAAHMQQKYFADNAPKKTHKAKARMSVKNKRSHQPCIVIRMPCNASAQLSPAALT